MLTGTDDFNFSRGEYKIHKKELEYFSKWVNFS